MQGHRRVKSVCGEVHSYAYPYGACMVVTLRRLVKIPERVPKATEEQQML